MARTSLLQGLTVLLLAWALVHCQAPLEPQEEEEEDDPMEETEIETFLVPVVAKVEPVVCPGECSCTEEGAVDCAGVDLMDFPSELPESTRILSLQVGHTHPTQHPHSLPTVGSQTSIRYISQT